MLSHTMPHGHLPREAIRNSLLDILNKSGRTIRSIEAKRGHGIVGDGTQNEYAGRPVWHARQEIMDAIAKRLSIHPSLWGDDRVSSDFYNVVDQEIAKIRRRGLIADWNASKHIGIFRASRPLDDLVSDMRPSLDGAIPTNTVRNTEDTVLSEDDLKSVFLSILTRGKKDNTYKFALARVLLDYCWENRGAGAQTHEIPYEYLSDKFLRYYWHQDRKFRIKQDFRVNSVPKVVSAIREVLGDKTPGDFDMLEPTDVQKAEKKIRKTVFGHARSKTSLVVPRFQRVPSGSGVKERRVFYEYSDDKQKIYLKPEAFQFFADNHGILFRAVLAEWAKFLERTNGSLPKLVAKIERGENTARRGNLARFREMYLEYTCHCFYCCNRLDKGYIHVDHFIPWSYIFDDDAWNLVLACSTCNNKKSSSLAPNEFLDGLIRRNRSHSNRIAALGRSLDLLDAGKGWKHEIETHYNNCIDYGFGVASLS